MEMKKINSGKLRAIGYDARARMLQVQLDKIELGVRSCIITSTASKGLAPAIIAAFMCADAMLGCFCISVNARRVPVFQRLQGMWRVQV